MLSGKLIPQIIVRGEVKNTEGIEGIIRIIATEAFSPKDIKILGRKRSSGAEIPDFFNIFGGGTKTASSISGLEELTDFLYGEAWVISGEIQNKNGSGTPIVLMHIFDKTLYVILKD
jgi:hypothetical protein